MSGYHEYSIIGHSRAIIGRHLGTAAATVSALTVLAMGGIVELLHKIGWDIVLPKIIVWPVTAAFVFFVIHAVFDTYVWRWKKIFPLLQIPNLNGTWHCTGVSLNMDKEPVFNWEGTITIKQTWEKIWLKVQTTQSSSSSGSAALIREPDGSARLMYRYENEPDVAAPELQRHVGFAEITFSKDMMSGSGDYFNSKGRYSFGTMQLRRTS